MNYIIFDLEATCEKNIKLPDSEIIEIGAVRLDKDLKETGRFCRFIRPVYRPVLSEFCKRLTTIKQSETDSAEIFSEVLPAFEDWIEETGPARLYSWGGYDKRQILRESKMKNYSGKIQRLLENHFNLKEEYQKAYNHSYGSGMGTALKALGIPLEGTHHRGIDDAVNIAKIFKAIFHSLT